MEKAYLDENVREYELTKHLSLRLHFPLEFLRLRTTGRCEIEIPEWMFDLDAPGMYMRRIKSVIADHPLRHRALHRRALPADADRQHDAHRSRRCARPRTSAAARRSRAATTAGMRSATSASTSSARTIPRAVRQYDARQAIATSSGQNDSGLFQLNFDDPRYLPFEYMGAVSRWRIELPPENNYFDFDTLTDAVLSLNYTAREGGEPLRRAANASAQRHLPGDGWRFFDVRHEFPDAWQLLRDSTHENTRRSG